MPGLYSTRETKKMHRSWLWSNGAKGFSLGLLTVMYIAYGNHEWKAGKFIHKEMRTTGIWIGNWLLGLFHAPNERFCLVLGPFSITWRKK
jgi:hypothetical protein